MKYFKIPRQMFNRLSIWWESPSKRTKTSNSNIYTISHMHISIWFQREAGAKQILAETPQRKQWKGNKTTSTYSQPSKIISSLKSLTSPIKTKKRDGRKRHRKENCVSRKLPSKRKWHSWRRIYKHSRKNKRKKRCVATTIWPHKKWQIAAVYDCKLLNFILEFNYHVRILFLIIVFNLIVILWVYLTFVVV